MEQDSVGPFLSLVRCSELQFQRLYLVILVVLLVCTSTATRVNFWTQL